MTTEGTSGQTPETHYWTSDDGRTLVVHYDHHGITWLTREAMTELLQAAGLTQTGQNGTETALEATPSPSSVSPVIRGGESA